MNEKQPRYDIVRILSILVLLNILLTTTAAVAASVTLRWDPVDPAPEGYRLFARKSTQAFNYSQPNWVGTATTGTINNLEDQTEYYFVVRAYDDSLMSSDSNEARYIPPIPYNPPPDTTPPSWDGATTGIGLASDTAMGGSVTVEFDTAQDVEDGSNLRFNVYYAASGHWNNADWTGNSVFADATVGVGSTFTHAVTLSGLTDGVRYTFGVRVEDQSGNEDANTRTLTATPTVSKQESNAPYQQDPGPDGVVSIGVENFDANVSRGGHDWVPVYPSGYSGSGAMQAQPNTGAMNDTGYVTTSPRLDYAVNFVHTGMHYVWVKGLGADRGADSVHVGLDGRASATSDRMSNFTPVLTWSNDTKDQAVARVYVATTGIHTVNVWMREDGFVIDKLVLSDNPGFRPTGEGPVVNPRGSALGFNPNVLTFSVEEGGATTSLFTHLGASDSRAVTYTITDDAPWLLVSPHSGTTPRAITASIDAARLTAGTYTATITASAVGYTDDSVTVTLTVTGSNAPYQQDPGPDGVVSIEVENFDAHVSRGGHDWVPVYPSGYSGSGAMQAQPNTGAMINAGYVSTSPRLDYTVNFVHTGIHYVWVRGLGANKGADSVHVGIDGHASATSDRMNNFTPVWRWSNDTKDQAVARVNVGTTGIHTVNVWMREDGFVIDKLVLTVKAGFTPN